MPGVLKVVPAVPLAGAAGGGAVRGWRREGRREFARCLAAAPGTLMPGKGEPHSSRMLKGPAALLASVAVRGVCMPAGSWSPARAAGGPRRLCGHLRLGPGRRTPRPCLARSSRPRCHRGTPLRLAPRRRRLRAGRRPARGRIGTCGGSNPAPGPRAAHLGDAAPVAHGRPDLGLRTVAAGRMMPHISRAPHPQQGDVRAAVW
jgi:hypothetical protein